jgi:hypothetical protein
MTGKYKTDTTQSSFSANGTMEVATATANYISK